MATVISIGSAPVGERAAEIWQDDFVERNARECAALHDQILRQFGDPPRGARLGVETISVEERDHPPIQRVVARFDPQGLTPDEQRDALLWIDDVRRDIDGYIAQWDREARAELGLDRPPAAVLGA
jgi:hypothetical protein